jgi:hypothetical protein
LACTGNKICQTMKGYIISLYYERWIINENF